MQNLKQQKFSFRKRLYSFKFAFQGLKILLKEEPNARIQCVAAIGVFIAGFVFKISATEWIAIVFAAGLVTALEALNSSVENLADFISPGKNHQIKKVKDLSAAGVLISAIAALIVGLIIFVPKIALLF
jgi:diacylglycerol kinase